MFSFTTLSYVISVCIFAFSLWDAVRRAPDSSTNPSWVNRAWPKVVVIVLSLGLLFVQVQSNEEAGVKAEAKLNKALSDQREQLTQAFKVGTDQIIKSTSDEADKIRRNAATQTKAIKRQAIEQLTEVQGAMLGTKTCPVILAGIDRPSGRPDSLEIFNLDKKLNMYDLGVELTEFGPIGPGQPWGNVLQQRTINVPLIIPESVRNVPFKFLSKMTDIDVQILLNTKDYPMQWETGRL